MASVCSQLKVGPRVWNLLNTCVQTLVSPLPPHPPPSKLTHSTINTQSWLRSHYKSVIRVATCGCHPAFYAAVLCQWKGCGATYIYTWKCSVAIGHTCHALSLNCLCLCACYIIHTTHPWYFCQRQWHYYFDSTSHYVLCLYLQAYTHSYIRNCVNCSQVHTWGVRQLVAGQGGGHITAVGSWLLQSEVQRVADCV